MLEIEIFDTIIIYIMKYCFLGFTINIPYRESSFKIKLAPFNVDEFWYRLVKKCTCCDLFMFDLAIPFVMEISAVSYLGEPYEDN